MMNPPSSWPRIEPNPIIAPYKLNATRLAEPRKLTWMNERACGNMTAAEAPCRRRHMISIHDVDAQPHIAEVKVKAVIPAINVRLRPKMSPRRPPVTRQTAYVSPYPAMTSSISLNDALSET